MSGYLQCQYTALVFHKGYQSNSYHQLARVVCEEASLLLMVNCVCVLIHRRLGRRKLVKREEARWSEAQRVEVRGPKGRGGGEVLGERGRGN